MKRFKVVLIALPAFLALALPQAFAGDCRSRITTAENILTRMNEDRTAAAAANIPRAQFWRIDVAGAREHLGEAKSYLQEGLELNCQLHVIDALRRLGVEQ